MDRELNKLIEIAYSMYPKGIEDRTDDYRNTLENKRLEKALIIKNRLSNILEEISIDIISENNQLMFENLSHTPLGPDRCVKGQFYQDINRRGSFFVFISAIRPYYLIYESAENYYTETVRDLNRSSKFIKSVDCNLLLFRNIEKILLINYLLISNSLQNT
jgi:hypothetical protein